MQPSRRLVNEDLIAYPFMFQPRLTSKAEASVTTDELTNSSQTPCPPAVISPPSPANLTTSFSREIVFLATATDDVVTWVTTPTVRMAEGRCTSSQGTRNHFVVRLEFNSSELKQRVQL